MPRITALFLTFCLFLWVLPLGAFIKPSQEKMACDGQRAFHMCSMVEGNFLEKQDSPQKVALASASSVEKQAKSSATGGDDLILLPKDIHFFSGASHFFEVYFFRPTQPFTASIDRPPINFPFSA